LTSTHLQLAQVEFVTIFKEGKLAEQIVGYVPKDTIDETVNRILA
jgi:hypothetical protein